MNNYFKKIFAAAAAFALTASVITDVPVKKERSAHAAASSYRFDFGNGGVEWGYTGVSASTGYDYSRGYGFAQTWNMQDSSASGQGVLSDSVVFKSLDKGNTFNADLEKGLYKITVHLGNTTRASVVAEDVLQLINLTGNGAEDSFIIPVTDGQLNLRVTEGKENTVFSLSALEIDKISDSTDTPKTVWICGDSTVCNYYPKDTAQRVGWGQVFDQYISSDLMIRNLAASGQYAAGFVNSGQFDTVLKYGKPGDFYIISIGINDTNSKNSTESEYYQTVTDMTKKAKEKGMTVVLVKQQGRADDISRSQKLTGRWFGSTLDKIGAEQNVQVLDLFNLAQDYFFSIGQDRTYDLYDSGDTLHFNRDGAKVLARLVSENIDFTSGGNSQETVVTTVTTPAQTVQTTTQTEIKTEKVPVTVGKGIYGDANDDGEADLTDLTLLSVRLMKREPFSDPVVEKRMDFDEDGDVSIADLAMLKQYVCKDSVRKIGTEYTETEYEEVPVYSFKSKYYALEGEIYQGMTETTNSGFEGEAYVNLDNVQGSSLTWNNIEIPEEGNYMVTFRIANQSESNREMKLVVNGDTENFWVQPFNSTGAWTTWEDRGIVLPFKKGTNTLSAISNMSEGGPNIDYIRLEKTDEPYALVYSQDQYQQTPVSANPVLYIASDSTAQSYNDSYKPQQGWGYYLSNYFNSNVTVANNSIAGRSSKKFYDEGRLDRILGTIKEGDYLLVSFAINDAGYTNAERYAPVCGNAQYPTDGSYEFYINKYVESTLEKGATPILMSPTLGLKAYSNGRFNASYTEYTDALKQISSKYQVPFIDLNGLMVDHYNSIGYDNAKLYHLAGVVNGSTDMTHFSEAGADKVAGLVAGAIKNLGISLSNDVK